MYSFQVERFEDCFLEAYELMQAHWEEIAENKELLDRINPDVDLYLRIQEAGMMKTVTARLDGRLVGYFILLLKEHPHYKHVKIGADDLYFVSKEHRRWGMGIKFLRFVEVVAKEAGCQMLILKTKHNKRDLSPLFFYLDYNPTEIVYTKQL